MSTTVPGDVALVGGGVAGLSTDTFTARHGSDTLVLDREGRSPSGSRTESCDAGESMGRPTAHLENTPGVPAGVNPHQAPDLIGRP